MNAPCPIEQAAVDAIGPRPEPLKILEHLRSRPPVAALFLAVDQAVVIREFEEIGHRLAEEAARPC